MYRLKILLVGPSGSGKSTIANFLSEATENIGDYQPTKGVRILEFESQSLNVNSKFVKADIELWDCGGDMRYELCWPALQHETQGVVFVYNPSVPEHARQLEQLYSYFVAQPGLSPRSCLVLANQKTDADRDTKHAAKLSNTFNKVLQTAANVEESSNKLRVDFSTFLSNVLGGLRDKNEQEELNIMNMM